MFILQNNPIYHGYNTLSKNCQQKLLKKKKKKEEGIP